MNIAHRHRTPATWSNHRAGHETSLRPFAFHWPATWSGR